MIGKRGSLILTLVGEADFRTLIREKFSNSIPSFDGSLDVESTLFGSIKLMGCLTWSIFPWRTKSNL